MPALRNITFLLVPLVLLLSTAGLAAAFEEAPTEAEHLQAFVQKHCVQCHGPEKQEAELRLDTLTQNFQNPQAATQATAKTTEKWQAVIERLEQGDMPPEGRPRPGREDQRRVLKFIETQLQSRMATAEKIRGPRRLNRLEYENTLHDLLGIDIPLAGLLPEDGIVDGFDKVGDGLDLSPALVERYLEAASLAIDAAYAGPTDVPQTSQRYFLQNSGRGRRVLEKAEWWIERDEAVVLWLPHEKWICVEEFTAPVRGRYRVRISGYGCHVGEGDTVGLKSAVLAVHGGYFEVPRTGHLSGLFDLAWEKPTIVEFEDQLRAGDTFKLIYGGRDPRTRVLAKYKGPAVAIQWIEVEGPLPPEVDSRQKLFGDIDPDQAGLPEAEQVLHRFAQQAFRRPVSQAELASHRQLMRDEFAAGQGFHESLRAGLLGVLCDPNTLFLVERPQSPESSNTVRLDDYAIASRLSYFLWCSMPDEELFALAAAGKLQQPDVRRQQVERMLADPRAQVFVEHFLDSWLDLKAINDTTPDRSLYRDFDEPLQDAMLRETRTFFSELLARDLSVGNLIDSDFAMLNQRLAKHYGIAGVEGVEIRKVGLPEGSQRGGLMTQGSVLKVTANGTLTSPVTRGVWLLDRILGRPVPPPPAGVPAVEPDIRGAVTIREQLARHQTGSCASCHKKIDPLGFALENFDAVGGWREQYPALNPDTERYERGPAIESQGQLPDGRKFTNIQELKDLLAAQPRDVAVCVTRKLFTYALGRAPEFADRQQVAEVVDRAKLHDLGLRTLLKELVASEAFVSN